MKEGYVTKNRRLIPNLATQEELTSMEEQVLYEMCSNAHNYAIFAKRWRDELRPLLELKRYLVDRQKEIELEKLNEKRDCAKEGRDTNSKASAKDSQKKK